MEEQLIEYRQDIINTQRKLNENCDKLLITLSGCALALSITFLMDVIGSNKIIYAGLMLSSWRLFV